MSEPAPAKPGKTRGEYQRERRKKAEREGRCARCVSKTRRAEPGRKTCAVCLDKQAKNDGQRTDRPVAKKQQRAGEGDAVRVARKSVATGKCAKPSCKLPPDGAGFSYCRAHGAEYAKGLSRAGAISKEVDSEEET